MARGAYPISGNNYLEVDATSFQLSFSQPQAAFGFYGVEIGDFGGALTLNLVGGGSTVVTVPNNTTSAADGAVIYFGLIVTAGNEFSSITFGNSNSADDVFAFDDFTIGTQQQVSLAATPLPASSVMGMTMIGLLGGFVALRKRLAAA